MSKIVTRCPRQILWHDPGNRKRKYDLELGMRFYETLKHKI
jgi:hypothetical protein